MINLRHYTKRELMIYIHHLTRTVKCSRSHWDGYMVRMGATRNEYKILVEKPLKKRPQV